MRQIRNQRWARFAAGVALLAPLALLSACRQPARPVAAAPLPPLRLQVSVDRPIITIGDLITYTIAVDAETNVGFSMPEFAENLGGFAIKDWERGAAKIGRDGRMHHEQKYVLETYLTGMYEIPPAAVAYAVGAVTNVIKSTPICVEVKTVMSDKDTNSIRDIKTPVAIATPAGEPLTYWTVGAVGLVLLLLALWLLLRHLRRKAAALPPPVPAHEIAYAALRAMYALQLIEAGRIKEYYIALCDILRHYIENRFGLRAPERTTEEFLQELHASKALAERYQPLLERFLLECDLVKFANFNASKEDAGRAHDVAVQFIEETRERPEQAAVGAAS